MKHAQRLDDARLAEVLNDRGMADLDAIRDLLQVAQGGGMLFTEALVTTNLVGDWDLSKVAAEIFQLPFLPVGTVQPDAQLWSDLDQQFLSRNGLVPLSRFGQVLTVAMPALVPTDVLKNLSEQSGYSVLPVVGTVETNRRWLLEQRSGTAKSRPGQESDWGALFDAGDENVKLSLTVDDEDDASLGDGLEALGALAHDAAGDEDLADMNLNGDFTEDELASEAESAPILGDVEAGDDHDLPPMPEF